jgi:hypothetical protein
MGKSIAILAAALCLLADSSRADFTPVHPYVYMDSADIAVMRDNVLVKQYPWAVNLYNKARQCSKNGGWETIPKTYTLGKNMLGCALVYWIDGDVSYADAAVYYLNLFKNNYDPRDETPVGSYTRSKLYHFTPFQVLIPITYDLMYNYMAASRPADLAALTTYMEWLADRFQGSFGHNENHQNNYGEGICGYVLGRADHISQIETAFKAWYNGTGQVHGGFYYEPGSQAMKHYAYVIESQIHYVNAAHRAAQKGYTTWGPVTWETTQGWNVVRENWRMLAKKSTPLFQVPYEAIWRGNLYLIPTCSGIYNIAYCMTGNTEWQAMAAQNPGREILHHSTTNTYWAGLSHGREITGTPRFKNESVQNTAIGFAVLLSGDPAGYTDPATALHAYLKHGVYGEGNIMNLKIYGKGKLLTAAPLESPDDSWGNRGDGGSIVPYPSQPDLPTNPCPGNQVVWDVTDPAIKVMGFENHGHHRSIAVTDDYFVDVYDVQVGGTVTQHFHGLGPATSALSRSGTFAGDFTCTWPEHMKAYVINDGSSEVSLGTMTNAAHMAEGVSDRLVNPVYTTEHIRNVRIRRYNVASATRFIMVIEPLGAGSVLSSAVRFNTANTANVTGLKITAGTYTDYYFYANTAGAYTLANGSDSVTLNGRWGFIRKYNSGTLLVKGAITSHNISGTPVADKVSTPQITPSGGTFSGSVQVTLACATSGAGVYYTTNGSTPTAASTPYTAPFTLTGSATVKAIGIKSGCDSSDVASAAFTISTLTAAIPTFSPNGGSFTGSVQVTIACATSGASIYYTTNGADPDSTAVPYTAAITLTATTTLKARAYHTGYNPSGVATATFSSAAQTVAAPVFTPNGGYFDDTVQVTITCATSGAVIRYTTNGYDPDSASTVCSGPLTLTASAELRAAGFKAGLDKSPVVTAIFIKNTGVLFDDFEGGPKLRWLPLIDTAWTVDPDGGDDAYHLNITGYPNDYVRPGQYSLLDEGTFDEFTLEMEARTPDAAGTADFGIVFGFVNEDNFYYVSLNRYTTSNYIYKVSGGRKTILYTFSEALAAASYRAYKLTVDNGTVSVYVDGALNGSVTEAVPAGLVGLCSINNSAYFDNFRLTPGGGSVAVIQLPVSGAAALTGPVVLRSPGTVRFLLPVAGQAWLEIWDVAGRRVAALSAATTRAFCWDTTRMAGGVYIYRLWFDGKEQQGKVVIVR